MDGHTDKKTDRQTKDTNLFLYLAVWRSLAVMVLIRLAIPLSRSISLTVGPGQSHFHTGRNSKLKENNPFYDPHIFSSVIVLSSWKVNFLYKSKKF